MNPLILVAGLPGAGKSSVARRIAEAFSPSVHLEVDGLRRMMVHGYLMPDQVSGWTDELTRQQILDSEAAMALANVYHERGITVVIDDVALPPVFRLCYAAVPNLIKVLLLPNVEALTQRLAARGDVYDETFAPRIGMLHGFLTLLDKGGWIVLDSSDWTLEQTVERVLEEISSS